MDRAKVFLAAGDFDKTLLHGQKSWEALGGMEAKWRDMGIKDMSVGLNRNKCATAMGLAAFQKGDVKGATKWLKASLMDGQFVIMLGYDLRQAEQLVHEPSAREDVIRYLEVARLHGPDETNPEAEKLLLSIKP
ncbi:hypothetical protein J7M28_02595 [bacterium]|nr:hypothetical protein [bacterium]